MISPSDFYRLNCAAQADLLLQQATYLQSWKEESLIVDLYELDDLLIELYYQYPGEELVSITAYHPHEKKGGLLKTDLQPRLTIKSHKETSQPQDKSFAA